MQSSHDDYSLKFKPTSKVSGGSNIPTLFPNHVKVASTKARSAIKAIRFAPMLATSLMEAEAPALAASIILRSGLK